MGKNIVICCDGTGNQFGEENSNVVKLYSVLQKDAPRQIAYYDPGVGTLSDPGLSIPFGKKISVLLGLAFGYGLKKNITEAYSYLMENYEEGDKIFLFGFSRGAYTVRVLAGFMQMNGLLAKGCQNLIPYSWQMYQAKNFGLSARFRKNYGRDIKIHFIGIWDTVSSIGWITANKSFPYTANNPLVQVVRHASAIDECRAYYDHNHWGEKKDPHLDIKEVWFAGVHSDIGGSYAEKESGLSKITLAWMIREAKKFDLEIDPDRYDRVVLGLDNDGTYVCPDYNCPIHKSLHGAFWWLLEIIPKKIKVFDSTGTNYRSRYIIPFGHRRTIKEGAVIHQSVLDKMRAEEYKPTNIPAQYVIEN